MGKRHTPKNGSGKRIPKTDRTPHEKMGDGRLAEQHFGNGLWQQDAPPPPPSFLDRLRQTYTSSETTTDSPTVTPEQIRRTIEREKG